MPPRLLSAVVLLALASAAGAAGGHPPNIVIVSGTDVMLPASQVEDTEIRKTLSAAGFGLIGFYSEGLDAYRFRSAEYEQELAAFWERKYREVRPDIVFALSESALRFVMAHRDQIWPGAPVVFTSVGPDFFRGAKPPEWVTGIYEGTDAVGTARLIEALQPGVRRIIVVAGVAPADQTAMPAVVEPIRALKRFEVEFRTDVPVEGFARAFGSLPSDTVLLATTMFRDADGRMAAPREVAPLLSSASSVPVYAIFSTVLGEGILGGALFDFDVEGKAAGEMGVRILKGESPSAIPVQSKAPSLVAVDARQLRRFRIPERRVPPGTEIRFRRPTFWEQYWKQAIAVGLALVLETALIAALLIERRQRRRAEEETRQGRRELAHAGRLTAVGELTASISHEINQPLGAILTNAEAAEMLLDGEGSIDEVRRILADIRRDDLRASEVVRRVRSLAGKREVESEPIDPNAQVHTVARLLEYEAKRQGAVLEKDLAVDLPPVRGDEVSFQQVLINLALNGIEAMADTPAGRRRLRIQTRSAGDRVEVCVSDRGHGIAEGDRGKLFQSFFTTKAHGVGLGLSICRSIVEAHGGRIRGENDPDGGATFSFTLPVYAERSRADARRAGGGPRA